jgi:NCS1 family nucleobase:cation symporter-1
LNASERVSRLELKTIQPIPPDARHGRARDLFTVWFGSNVHLLTIVTGALSVTVFGLPFTWPRAGLVRHSRHRRGGRRGSGGDDLRP